jgi:hypothetical protein
MSCLLAGGSGTRFAGQGKLQCPFLPGRGEEVDVADLKDLMREYERAHFPADRRLDLHGESPGVARERALHWIQSRAHEEPGQQLLLIVERGVRPGQRPSAVSTAVRELLERLDGKLLEWWQTFAPGSYAVRISPSPTMFAEAGAERGLEGDGRTEATAGAATPAPMDDIPPDLLEEATRVAELRVEREGLSVRVLEVVLREVWIETQALAMEERITFEAALQLVLADEAARVVRE